MKNSKLFYYAVLHSLGVLAYVFLVALLLFNGQAIFGHMNTFLGPAAMLLLLVLSATIVGALVLARPGIMYLNGMKKEGILLLSYTVGCLFVLTVLVFLVLALLQ